MSWGEKDHATGSRGLGPLGRHILLGYQRNGAEPRAILSEGERSPFPKRNLDFAASSQSDSLACTVTLKSIEFRLSMGRVGNFDICQAGSQIPTDKFSGRRKKEEEMVVSVIL